MSQNKFSSNHVYPFIITLLFEALVYVFMCNGAYFSYMSVYRHPVVMLIERNFVNFNYTGEVVKWALNTMWWHLWNGRYHFKCNRVLLDTMLFINRGCFLPVVLVPKVIFFGGREGGTIESLFVPASLVGNADISGCLRGWASTSAHGLCTEQNTCPWCFWHCPACLSLSFFLPRRPWSHALTVSLLVLIGPEHLQLCISEQHPTTLVLRCSIWTGHNTEPDFYR